MAVTAVALHWPATIEFLCACAGKRALVPGLVVADDLAYWVQALRLAAAMVARQHFLPDIVEERGKLFARWRAVPSHAESRAMAELAAAMPDACRAIAADPSAPQPSAESRALRVCRTRARSFSAIGGRARTVSISRDH